jgi:hypothetical protein
MSSNNTQTSGNSTPPAAGGSNNSNSSGGKKDHRGNRYNNNQASKVKKSLFSGLAGSDTALYEKVVTIGPNQATQIIDLIDALVTHCGAKGYGKWAESITTMQVFRKQDFVGTPPQQVDYGTVTKVNNVDTFKFDAFGEESYKIEYDIWKAEFGIMLKDFKQYEKDASHIFLAIKGQFEPVAWDELDHESRFAGIIAKQCPVQLISMLMETCSTNESSTWEPLGRIRHLRKSITYMQKPKSAPIAVDTAQYKKYLSVYVSNAFKAGGDFVFGTKFYEPFLDADGKTLVQYLGMTTIEKRTYDKQVQDLLVAVLMIEGCKSKPLKDHLKNNHLTNSGSTYPTKASKAFELIDNFVSDETAPAANPERNRDRQRNRDRRSKRNEADGVAGAHVHQDEEVEETNEIRALVLAAVKDEGIIHENAFEPIATREEFEDEELGEVACVIIGDHYYPSDDETMNSDGSEESDPLAIVLIDGQDDSSYKTEQSMDYEDEFSYDDSVETNELPSLCSHSSSSIADSTVANGDFQSVICEASYVCDTDEDSSAATFTSHDDSIIDNIQEVRLDTGASNSFYNNPNISKLRVPIRMEQSVRRYLDDIILDVPKSTGINGRPSQNIATMIDVRQRFGGSVQIIRKEDLCLGMSNTRY